MRFHGKENQSESPKLLDLSPDAKSNLVGFFVLLLKVDKRVNPHLYKSNNKHS